jgi:hypothetical protein
MKTSRRIFLKTSGMAAAALQLSYPEIACSGRNNERIVALQLYSVREK